MVGPYPALAASNAELVRMIFLDSIDEGLGVPDGCDIEALSAQGLIEPDDEGWLLTPRGQRQLRKLKSCGRRGDGGK